MHYYKLNEESIATTQKAWMGIDVHKRSLHITVLDEEGAVVMSQSMPHAREHVAGVIKRIEADEIVAVYEAGPTGYKLLGWLEDLGCDAFMTPPTHVRQKRGGKKVKTDERDSYDLAEQARAGMLPAVHALDEETYRERQVVRTRKQLVEHRSATKAQIKSLLLFHGISPPEGMKANWSKRYMSWLKNGPSDDENLNLSVEAFVNVIDSLDKQIKRLEKRLGQLEESQKWQEEVKRLRSIPGVGAITAMLLLLELGDISRFDRCEELSSWLGLAPRERSSGDGQKKGSITRAGNRRARSALVEASWGLIRKDARMRRIYERIKHKAGAGVAIVAVARRLALAIRAMLRDQKEYEYEAVAA